MTEAIASTFSNRVSFAEWQLQKEGYKPDFSYLLCRKWQSEYSIISEIVQDICNTLQDSEQTLDLLYQILDDNSLLGFNVYNYDREQKHFEIEYGTVRLTVLFDDFTQHIETSLEFEGSIPAFMSSLYGREVVFTLNILESFVEKNLSVFSETEGLTI